MRIWEGDPDVNRGTYRGEHDVLGRWVGGGGLAIRPPTRPWCFINILYSSPQSFYTQSDAEIICSCASGGGASEEPSFSSSEEPETSRRSTRRTRLPLWVRPYLDGYIKRPNHSQPSEISIIDHPYSITDEGIA